MKCGKCQTPDVDIAHVRSCYQRICHGCGGSGTRVVGPIINEVPRAVFKCNCCAGKGFQTPQDIVRDNFYHAHHESLGV